MLKRIRAQWERFTVSLKLSIRSNLYLLIAVAAAGVIGLIIAISSCMGSDYSGNTVNVFILIQTESFSFFGFFFKLLIYYAVFALLLFLSGCHFYFLCGAFVGLAATSFFYAKGMIFSIMFDGFAGFFTVIFYMLPIALVFLFTYFCALKDIYGCVGFSCNRKRFSNINFYKRPVLKSIFKMLLWNLVFDLILTIIIAIIAEIF